MTEVAVSVVRRRELCVRSVGSTPNRSIAFHSNSVHVWEPPCVRKAGGNYPFYFGGKGDVISLAGRLLLRSCY